MYQRIGSAAFKKDLTNIIALCDALDNPQKKFKSIHIAGTNGKGSCSHLLEAYFRKSGLRTGLYTSPHLVDFRERIRIAGQCIAEQEVVDFVQKHQDLIEKIEPSFFEITVALAFNAFAKNKVDIAIIETGLGGRLDSTNIINPLISLITNIGMDHMDLLGDTLELIAAEKAGIIKSGIPAVIGEWQEEVAEVFAEKSKIEHTTVVYAEDILMEKQHLDDYQKINRRSARAVIKVLSEMPDPICLYSESEFQACISMSVLKGRWQKFANHPTCICDTGHNKDGVVKSMKLLEMEKFQQLHIVWGVVTGKSPIDVLQLLPKNAKFYFTQPDVPRGMPVKELAALAKGIKLNGPSFDSALMAYQAALNEAEPEDLIFIGGSTFVVGNLLRDLHISTC
jgi:dihydrofolate synthase/folylpolyglutamate synthase